MNASIYSASRWTEICPGGMNIDIFWNEALIAEVGARAPELANRLCRIKIVDFH